MAKAMQITLYGDDNEPRETYSRLFVPWKLLKRAISLAENMKDGKLTDESIDDLAGLVVDVFGNKFTVEDLNQGADVGEMMAVLTAIVGRASGQGQGSPLD